MAAQFGLSFFSTYFPVVDPPPGKRQATATADVVQFMHSRHFRDDLFAGRSIRGSHIVRDPRDIAVSAYRYHLWTDEPWVNTPRDDLNGRTYQEHLNSLSESDGLLVEIERSCRDVVTNMRVWNYDRPDFLELRYEDLIQDEDACFERLFAHYGFSQAAIASSVQIARHHSFAAKTGRAIGDVAGGSHLRSGKPGQWRAEFRPEHVASMKRLANDVLIRLGYESDDDWTV